MNPEDDAESVVEFAVSMVLGALSIFLLAAMDSIWLALRVLGAFFTALYTTVGIFPLLPIAGVLMVLVMAYVVVTLLSRLPSLEDGLDADVGRTSVPAPGPQVDDEEDDVDPVEEARERYANGEIDILELEQELEEALEDSEVTEDTEVFERAEQ